MLAAVLDTHAAHWYIMGDARLSKKAFVFIREAEQDRKKLILSAISMIEFVYLIEKGRIPAETFSRLSSILVDPEGSIQLAPIDLNISRMLAKVDSAQVPDLPDRVIAATALYFNIPLVSRDAKIKLTSLTTIW